MKSIFPLVIVCLYSNFVFGQSNADSIIRKNRVKEVRILDSQNNLASVTKYDSSGRIIFNALDNFGGARFLKTSLTKIYDEHGNCIKSMSTHSSYPNEITVWIYEYDQKGNKISVKTKENNLLFQYFYDDTNFLIKKLAYDDDNKIRQTMTYEKTNDGKKIIEKNIGEFIKNRTNTTYLDDNGNEIKTESYDGDKINFSTNSTYEKNKLTKIMYNSGDGNNYFYDSNGRLIKREQFKGENGTEILGNFEEFLYSNDGLIKTYKENIYSINSINEYRYEYDFQN